MLLSEKRAKEHRNISQHKERGGEGGGGGGGRKRDIFSPSARDQGERALEKKGLMRKKEDQQDETLRKKCHDGGKGDEKERQESDRAPCDG